MKIKSLEEAINLQIDVSRFLVKNNMLDQVDDYGEFLVQQVLSGKKSAINQGFDIFHNK